MVQTAHTNGPLIVFSYFSFTTTLGKADCDRYIFSMPVCDWLACVILHLYIFYPNINQKEQQYIVFIKQYVGEGQIQLLQLTGLAFIIGIYF